MAFTAATKFPSLAYYQWQNSATLPSLAAPALASDTTIYFNIAPVDHTGAVITTPFLMGIKKSTGYVETVYLPNGANGLSGLSATSVVRGIRLEGLDFTTSDSTLAVAHDQDEEIFCNITGVLAAIQAAALQGTLATGGSGLIIGTDAVGTVTVSRSTGAGTNVGWLRWLTGTNRVQFSDNGSAWTNMIDVTSSFLVKNSAADTTQSYLASKLTAGTNVTLTTLNPGGNETTKIDVASGLSQVKNTVADTTPNYLASKLTAGTNVTLTTTNPGGNETTQIDVTPVETFGLVTAKEAITIGKPVAESSTSGQFENLISSQFRTADAGSAVAFDTGAVTNIYQCQASSTGKVAVIYTESAQWWVIAGTVPPDSKVITWGTRQQIAADVADVRPGATYISDDLVVFTYVRSDNKLYARAATLSGTVFTSFDTERLVHGATVDNCSVATIDTNKVQFAFNDSVTFAKVSIGSLAAGVLTVDSANEQPFGPGVANAVSYITSCKSAASVGFIAYRDGADSKAKSVGITAAGTVPIPGGVSVAIDANNVAYLSCSNISASKVIVAWRDQTSNINNAAICTLAGTVITPQAELSVSSVANCTHLCVYAYTTTKAIIIWRDITSTKGTGQLVAIGATTLTLIGAPVDFVGAAVSGSGSWPTALSPVNSNGKFMISYVLNSTSDGTGIVYQDYINTDLYAGTAASTVAAAGTFRIRQNGIDTNQSGLTLGQPVTTQGITIGKAITATSMEVTVAPGSSFGSNVYSADISNTDDYVVNLSPAPTAYITGMEVSFKATTANTGAATVNVNGLGAKAIKKDSITGLATGDILAGQIVDVRYDGTNFQLMSKSALGGTRKLLFDTTAVNINNSNSLTTLVSTTILGGTLGTSTAIRGEIFISAFGLSNGATNCAFSVLYGASTVAALTFTGDVSAGAVSNGMRLSFIFAGAGATNAQKGNMTGYAGNGSFDNAGTTANVAARGNTVSTTAVDSTVDQTLAVKAQFNTATGTDNLDYIMSLFEIVS